MQIKIFTVPVLGGERANEELNTFLRSKRVLQEEHCLMESDGGPLWCFCIKYLEGGEVSAKGRADRVDYREVLDAESFQRYSAFREIRKKVAEEDGLKVFRLGNRGRSQSGRDCIAIGAKPPPDLKCVMHELIQRDVTIGVRAQGSWMVF